MSGSKKTKSVRKLLVLLLRIQDNVNSESASEEL